MFDLPRPCDNCPFRRVGGIRLHPVRAREIADSQIDNPGKSFPCHKTVPDALQEEANDTGTFFTWPKGMQYCAGGIVFAIQHERLNQMLRIGERIGGLRPELYSPTLGAEVFGSVLEMVAAQTPRTPPRKKRGPLGGRKDRRQR